MTHEIMHFMDKRRHYKKNTEKHDWTDKWMRSKRKQSDEQYSQTEGHHQKDF